MDVFSVLAPAVAAFLGSSVATAVVSHYLTSRRSREDLLRAKLEELFLATSEFCLQFSASSLPYLSAMHGEITYDQANDLSAGSLDPSQRHFEKSQMLINLYHPEVLDLFDSLIAAKEKANDVNAEFKRGYAQVQRSTECVKRFENALHEFDEKRNLLRLALATLSRDMLWPPSLFAKASRWFQRRRTSKPSITSVK